MKTIPWEESNLIYKFTKGNYAGIRIEEVKTPWDLFLEACFLQTTFGEAFHITTIEEGKEVIFSIRDGKREPMADIVTMPVKTKRYDSYWPIIRIFKTSKPMTVNGQELIVLDVVGTNGRRASKNCVSLAQTFFIEHGGILGGEHPNGLTLPEGKALNKWKKVWNGQKANNLCIGSKAAFVIETQSQAFNLNMAISMLSANTYEEVYICVDEPWMELVMEHMKVNHPDRPVKSWRFYGDPQKVNEYIQMTRQWKKDESEVKS